MAPFKKFKEEKIISKRQDSIIERLAIQVNGLDSFYHLVSILNNEIGQGNWTTKGRPLRRLRKLEQFNSFVDFKRSQEIVFYIPKGYNFLSSRLMLSLAS
jgi:hypothetical protein